MRFNTGQFHLLRGDRLLTLTPSPGEVYFYLTVYNNLNPDGEDASTSWGEPQTTSINRKTSGERVWPTGSEKALGAWVAISQGHNYLVCKTPDGERSTKL